MRLIILLLISINVLAQEHIIINNSRANNIRGRYGIYSELNPIALPDTFQILPILCLTDNDLESVIPLLSGTINTVIDLPATGQVYKDSLYKYDGGLIICRQSHNRTIYTPNETPALFSFYRENSDTLTWIENEQVLLGWFRMYNESQYECIQAHMTLIGWEPNIANTLWVKVNTGCDEWVQPTGAHDVYNLGDCVTFNGDEYISLINNNSWSPIVYPQGWQKQ
jgi:hypothetical protein